MDDCRPEQQEGWHRVPRGGASNERRLCFQQVREYCRSWVIVYNNSCSVELCLPEPMYIQANPTTYGRRFFIVMWSCERSGTVTVFSLAR